MNPVNRATVVVNVAGREVARVQVRVEDGQTVTLELQAAEVVDAVGDEIVRRGTAGAAQFRTVKGEGQ